MRVLVVIPSLDVGGGAERSLVEMAPFLDGDGIELQIAYFFKRPSGREDEIAGQGIVLHHIEATNLVARARALRRVVRRRGINLVHTTLLEADLAGRLAVLGTAVPVLSSLVNAPYQNLEFGDPNVRRWRVRVVKAADVSTARRLTDHFHANSQAVKEASCDALGIDPGRVTVVHRGRDVARLGRRDPDRRRRTRDELGLAPDDPLILAVGRQDFQKGHLHLLRAFAELMSRRPRPRLVVAGRPGAMTPELQRTVHELGLEHDVVFLGHRDDVPALIDAADVFAFPSLYEGLPGAVMEAMALEAMIVASDIPPVRELLGDGTAILVAPRAEQALAVALGAALDDPEHGRELGSTAHQRFSEHFTLDRSVAGMRALYERVGRTSG